MEHVAWGGWWRNWHQINYSNIKKKHELTHESLGDILASNHNNNYWGILYTYTKSLKVAVHFLYI
jgi:hypothetical protein